ncbi:YxeA family protein [Paenalkalicoccus suaedae]|uniref:YxeA family protein n=1 Tax=Paenalkalicoccus suaedae TaxID=2592382 RepID=A0A859FIR3_9BACI|nr:YxeA family protein [Paenalkalicoccus suaedae]QKS72684.1 YxeA family protein [Paenalkalicoccus suaedae]
MKKWIIVAGVVVMVFASVYVIFAETIDRFNPFISEEFVYVQIQTEDEARDDDGRYKYDVEGVNADGEEKRVVFSTSIELEPGEYVRVLAKGRHASEYTFIEEGEMP